MAPTAPFAHNEEDFIQRYAFQPPAPSYDGASTYGMGAYDSLPLQSQNHMNALSETTVQGATSQNSIRRPDSQHAPLVQGRAPENGNSEDSDTFDEPSLFSQNPNCSPRLHEEGSGNALSPPLPDSAFLENQRHNLEVPAGSPDDTPANEDEASSASVATPPQQPTVSTPTPNEFQPAHTHDDHNDEELPVYKR